MPVVSHKRQLPVLHHHRFMALDEDGFDLPPDWYMRICGYAVESLRGERLILGTFPSKELQDYWSSRPHYEDEVSSSSAGGSGSKQGEEKSQTWEEWEKSQKGSADEPPPPPYTLEVEESQPPQTSSAPPVVPLERRPTQTQGAPPTPFSTRPMAPPTSNISVDPPADAPLNSAPYPQSLYPGQGSRPSSLHASPLLAPVEGLSRLSLSNSMPPSPLHDQPHPGRHSYSPSPSPQPVSPTHSHHSHHSSHSASGRPLTEPGFSPHLFPVPITPPANGPPGPWAQAQWPPPEWNSQPQGPAAFVDQFFHGDSSRPPPVPPKTRPEYAPAYPQGHSGYYPPQSQHHGDYESSYNTHAPPQSHADYGSSPHSPIIPEPYSNYSSPYPPAGDPGTSSLRPRPSLSYHTRPSSPPRQGHASSDDKIGGFAFPEAQVSPSLNGSFPAGPSETYSPYPPSSYPPAPNVPPFPGASSGYPPPPGPPPHPAPRKSALCPPMRALSMSSSKSLRAKSERLPDVSD